ncbi:MAG: hypothetical protein J5844_01685 [Clostridia bacterium]|nr:hypothetical protein [Clostridia bacterium]
MSNKFDKDVIVNKCKDGMEKAENLYEKAKDISVRAKLDTEFSVASKNKKDNIFAFDFKFDKEITLLKIIVCVLGIFAAAAFVSAVFCSIFSPKGDKED